MHHLQRKPEESIESPALPARIQTMVKPYKFGLEQHKADVRGNLSNAIFLHATNQHVVDWRGEKFIFNSKSKNLNRLIE